MAENTIRIINDYNINSNTPATAAAGDGLTPVSGRAGRGGITGEMAADNPRGLAVGNAKANLEMKKQDLFLTQQQTQAYSIWNNQLLAVNMSLLGLTFGYQGISKALNANRDAEMQELSMKKNKSKEDEKRIEQIKKEQIEDRKLQSIIQGLISTTQLVMSIAQIANVIRGVSIMQKQAEAQANVRVAQTEMLVARGTLTSAQAKMAEQAASAGWFAPIMVGIITAAAVAGIAIFGSKIPGLAHGGYIPAQPGGRLVQVGEGRNDEIVSPVPQLRQVIREETTKVISNGGGGTTIIYAMDSESFNEFIRKQTDSRALTGAN